MSVTQNFGIGIIALMIPFVAEIVSPETGLGFDLLLYWPFDFAYVLLVGVIFVIFNQVSKVSRGAIASLIVGLFFWLGWFAVSFLAVAQLHLALGYKL